MMREASRFGLEPLEKRALMSLPAGMWNTGGLSGTANWPYSESQFNGPATYRGIVRRCHL